MPVCGVAVPPHHFRGDSTATLLLLWPLLALLLLLLFPLHLTLALMCSFPPSPSVQAANISAKGSPWDVVMAGSAEGVLLRVPCLQPGCLDAAGGKVGAFNATAPLRIWRQLCQWLP